MRIIFTAYAINAAGLCFALTLGLSLFNEGESIEKLAMRLFHYTYIAFGPVLFLLCCAFGLPNIAGLVYRCELTRINREQVNTMDIMIVFGCTIFSGVITLMYSLGRVIDDFKQGLRDEKSVFYRVYRGLLIAKMDSLRRREDRLRSEEALYGGV